MAAGAQFSPVLAPACAAVRFGFLLSALSRLAHILLVSMRTAAYKQFFDGSNSGFRVVCTVMAGSHFAGGQGNTKARSCRRVGAALGTSTRFSMKRNYKISDLISHKILH